MTETARRRHPEQHDDEAFLGNWADEDSEFIRVDPYSSFYHIVWKTKRKGRVAYCTDGSVSQGDFPVFVKHSEIEAWDSDDANTIKLRPIMEARGEW